MISWYHLLAVEGHCQSLCQEMYLSVTTNTCDIVPTHLELFLMFFHITAFSSNSDTLIKFSTFGGFEESMKSNALYFYWTTRHHILKIVLFTFHFFSTVFLFEGNKFF
jgi:hypothetical protein